MVQVNAASVTSAKSFFDSIDPKRASGPKIATCALTPSGFQNCRRSDTVSLRLTWF